MQMPASEELLIEIRDLLKEQNRLISRSVLTAEDAPSRAAKSSFNPEETRKVATTALTLAFTAVVVAMSLAAFIRW